MKKNINKLGIIATVFYILTIIVNYTSAAGYINNMSQKDVSNKYSTIITPAGYTFLIWSVIYIGISIFLILSFLYYKNNNLKKSYKYFILSCIFNSLWVVSFSYEQIFLSFIIILLLAVSIFKIVKGLSKVGDSNFKKISTFVFEIYLGWIVIASLLNLTIFINMNVSFNTNYLIVFLLVFYSLMLVYIARKNSFKIFLLSPTWGCIGIIYKNYVNSSDNYVLLSALILSVLFLLANLTILNYKK